MALIINNGYSDTFIAKKDNIKKKKNNFKFLWDEQILGGLHGKYEEIEGKYTCSLFHMAN